MSKLIIISSILVVLVIIGLLSAIFYLVLTEDSGDNVSCPSVECPACNMPSTVNCSGVEQRPMYMAIPNMDSRANDIERVEETDLNVVMDKCNSNPECRGFNSSGWLKNRINRDLAATTAASTLYVKM